RTILRGALMRRPPPDSDAEDEHGRRRHCPAHPPPQLDDVLVATGRFDPLPHLLTGSGEWGGVRPGCILEPLLEPGIFVLVHHVTHSPAKSDSATRNFARARDS